jgi:hypothetical protein
MPRWAEAKSLFEKKVALACLAICFCVEHAAQLAAITEIKSQKRMAPPQTLL